MTRPTALIVTTAGINCDRELAAAFRAAGADVELRHLNELMADPSLVDGFELIGIPGGFSYGDAVAAGRVAAQLMRETLYGAFVHAIERGVPIIAPCNGFQIAVQMGLLPGPDDGATWPARAPRPTVTLAENEQGRFVDRWTRIKVPETTRCVWTQGLTGDDDTLVLPVAHGEGRFIPESDAVLDELDATGRIAVRYAADDDPNGSRGHVAGLCDASGLVLGLMPHPERYTRWTHHPYWTRLPASVRRGDTPGLAMFRNAVRHATTVAV